MPQQNKERRFNYHQFRIAVPAMLVISALLAGLAALALHRAGANALSIGIVMLAAALFGLGLYFLIAVAVPTEKAVKAIEDMKKNNIFEQAEDKDIIELLSAAGPVGKMLGGVASDLNVYSKSRMLNTEVALYALQEEINPHFLYNTLDAIRNYALDYGISEVADMTQSLSKIFRYSISRPGEVASLADEIDNVRNYIKIQQYRFPDRFDVTWVIDEENDDIMKYSMPVLTLQPLVENALNHGLESTLRHGHIEIRGMTTQSKLIISVTDNGAGIDPQTLDKIRENLERDIRTPREISNRQAQRHSGVSLNNVNQRIKLYYGQEYGLSIASSRGYGTTVEIVLPKI